MLKIDTHAHILPRELAESRRQIRRRPLSGHGPHRRWPPPHLQGRQVLPRGVGQRVRRGGAHRRLRDVRRRRAGRLDRAGAVLVLGQAEPGAGTASPSQRPHRRNLPHAIRATTPASAPCRCSRRRWRSRRWNAASTQLGLQGVQIGSHCENWNLDAPELFPFFEAAAELGAAILVHPWDMMGRESMPKYWLPWLVGMPAEQSRAACCLIFGGVLERLPKLQGLLRPRRRRVSVHDRAHRARLPHAPGSGRDRQRAQSARIPRPRLFRFLRARRRRAALPARRGRRRHGHARHRLSVSARRAGTRQRHRRARACRRSNRPGFSTAPRWNGSDLPHSRFADDTE